MFSSSCEFRNSWTVPKSPEIKHRGARAFVTNLSKKQTPSKGLFLYECIALFTEVHIYFNCCLNLSENSTFTNII
jgi:hypothetical protein